MTNGFVQVSSELLRAGVPSDELHVYLILCDYAGKKCVCWPSDRTIGGHISRSQDTVSRILGRLEARGLISRSRVEITDENPTGRLIITKARVAATPRQPLPQAGGNRTAGRPETPAAIPRHELYPIKKQDRPRAAGEPPAEDEKPLPPAEVTRLLRSLTRRI